MNDFAHVEWLGWFVALQIRNERALTLSAAAVTRRIAARRTFIPSGRR